MMTKIIFYTVSYTHLDVYKRQGLGLHIVAKYAELMNGSIKAESELGEGTEFIITFNLKNDE